MFSKTLCQDSPNDQLTSIQYVRLQEFYDVLIQVHLLLRIFIIQVQSIKCINKPLYIENMLL